MEVIIMLRIGIRVLCCVIALTAFASLAEGQRRRTVVVRRPHSTVVVRSGHPIRRPLPPVVVRPARRSVVVRAPLTFLPAVAWTAAVVALPARDRLVWQDSEKISEDEGWVDTNFGIDGQGEALYLDLDGRARLNFAEITFANGNVQVIDFNEKAQKSGVYKLFDFRDDRHVMTVRIVAKAESSSAKLTVYLGS